MAQWRVNLILFFIFCIGAVIIYRLFSLQVIQHDLYAALALGQQKSFFKTEGERGEIFFTNHTLPLATERISYFVYLSPYETPREERELVARNLSGIIKIDEVFLLEKLQKNSLYELIAEKINNETVSLIKGANLAGVHIGEEKVRSYPYKTFASHILGFVNKDGAGQYGLEEYWNDVLSGEEKYLEGERGPFGYLFSYKDGAENKGADIYLSIDYNIQYIAEKLLSTAGPNLNAEGGTIIVINPQTGEIIALAEWPSYNANEYSRLDDLSVFQVGAVQRIFEPGSVFKPLTMAAALNEGEITPETTYFDPGVLEIDGWPIYNYDQRVYGGEITMTGVLEKSINTGAVFAEQQVGHKKFLEYIGRFGIFEKTGIDLAGEILPQNAELKKGYEVNFATASFGQGIEMTPMQLIRAFSAIANGGKLITPHLVKEIRNSNNEIIEQESVSDKEGVISANTSQKLKTMLVSVVENGFGKAARIPGYYVAGKTGTAQVSWSSMGIGKGGYSDKTWQSFIGFAPAFNPRFLILVKLDNPATRTAEYSAVPIFKDLAKYIIDYYQIPPDYE